MAIRNFSLSLVATLTALTLLPACQLQTVKTAQSGAKSGTASAATPGGHTDGKSATELEEPQAQPVTRETPKKVAVILGPGGAKAFAHVGVLKALQLNRVPIEKVVGLEWGALMGGLFANKGQVNDLEWKLYKMEQASLPHPRGFFKRGDDSVKVMDDFLADAFGKDEVTRAKIAFDCPARSLNSGIVAWQNRGSLKDAVKRCLPYPPVFKIQGTFLAGASQATEAVEQLVKEGFNVIILVNVLGSALPVGQDSLLENANYVILWQEVKRALSEASKLNVETIMVDTSAYSVSQFEAKKDLISLGEAAGNKAAAPLITKYGF